MPPKVTITSARWIARCNRDDDFGTTNASDTELADKGLEKGKERLRIEIKRQPSSFGTEEKKPAVQDALKKFGNTKPSR